jgi:outer membrane lipoprotein-sorting protein
VLAALAAAAPWPSPAGAAGWGLEQLMRGFAQVKSSSARFVERKHVGILDAPLESSGTLVYAAPGRLEKHTLKPRAESLVLDGERLTLEDKAQGRSRTVGLQEVPVILAFVEGIRSTLAGDLGTLDRHYQVGFEGTERKWQLTLTPRAREMRDFVREIRIAGSGSRIGAIEILEAEGDRSVMTITGDGA